VLKPPGYILGYRIVFPLLEKRYDSLHGIDVDAAPFTTCQMLLQLFAYGFARFALEVVVQYVQYTTAVHY
jgi:hypothetical protein